MGFRERLGIVANVMEKDEMMAKKYTDFEDAHVLRDAEKLADDVWAIVQQWDAFTRETVGGRIVRAVDSIGANIAEAFGRYHYGEKRRFLYFARGSLYETTYWLDRAVNRHLFSSKVHAELTEMLASIARQRNAFVASIRAQRSVREEAIEYLGGW